MRLFLLILSTFVGFSLYAQRDENVYRLELGAGAGFCFGITDLKSKILPTGVLVARFPLNPRMAFKTQLGYALFKGGTDGVKPFYPADSGSSGTQRLDFISKGGLYDLSAVYELHFLPYGYERDYRRFSRLVPYIQMGLGFVYSTAGKAFSAQIPIGGGVKYKIAPRLNMGLDWLVHFSLSDKLDGLSAPLGIKSSGFRNKDHYSQLTLTLTYDLNPRCPTCNRDQ